MSDWYDILDAARKYGYSTQVPLTSDADITFIPEYGTQPERAFSYPIQGISLRADEVIEELKKRKGGK